MTETYADDMATALHEAAEFVAAYPDLPAPYVTAGTWGVGVAYQLSIRARDNQRAAAAQVARTIGGQWKKEDLGETFYMHQVIGRLKVEVTADREQVCTRRVVGTEQVTIPAVPARPERTEEREVVEWDCAPILADEAVTEPCASDPTSSRRTRAGVVAPSRPLPPT